MAPGLLVLAFLLACKEARGDSNADAKRLYDDLINGYNALIRPVGNNSDRLTVKMGLKLSQLIDVNIKNQIMTTNVWVEQEWNDYKLRWEPDEYGGVSKLHVPAEQIWLPDIVLYNNADGNYEVTIMTKAILHYDGKVIWKPPAIYKSSCGIDVEYFPFDEQTCLMKFGSWTYDGYTVDLKHKYQTEESNLILMGMDLSEFYLSVEWDIMAVPALRTEKFYSCCEEPYPDITFNITLRRKTLFYTVNLIIPCVFISFLSVLVFYLPSDSGEKVSLSISIVLSLGVFFLLLSEIIPPTSLTVPLLGKYLLFTMILVSFSVFVTIAVLNVNFRSPSTHKMAPWVKRVFIEILPRFLCMQRPNNEEDGGNGEGKDNNHYHHHHPHLIDFAEKPSVIDYECGSFGPYPVDELHVGLQPDINGSLDGIKSSPDVERAVLNVRFIAQHMENLDNFTDIESDWQYVAMVLDRLFLWIFTIACVVGTGWIILCAPSLYDDKQPIDIVFSKVGPRIRRLLRN
ncbi:acetylcholine receptor subunit alpha-like 1 [Argiope bruennichi]|uniref:Acetylcholine receptor subunit alpha-like 1 n=1 Tax=Argiope bruennichi TaxID=94029 RepID=A0A8T0ENV1_ARGBR|nr:acetylcholine receptor subunit alpha-like 1 [Argiope bruennichi]KAF8777583.1 Acetylcholine receptor subunit alpha-like 1 [Argiope bruennichi]